MKILKQIIRLKALRVLLPLIAVAMIMGVATAKEVAVIKVKFRRASELVPVVRSLLSDEGSVTVSERVNSLVIFDDADAIRRVYAYIDQFDLPVEQVRIHVRFLTDAAGEQQARSSRTRRRSSDRTSSFSESREFRHSSNTEAFVIASSGSPAFIRTGKEIPYLSSSPFFKRHAPGGSTVEWQSVESGFEVTPTIMGDNVLLKIVPRIAYDDRKDAVIRFFGAQTELTAPFGQWVEIGGASIEQNEIFREILSQRAGRGRTTTSMLLMVQRQ